MSTATTSFFEPASVTSSGRPVLHQAEVECHLLSSVDLETEPTTTATTPINSLDFPALKSGLGILTTHRLLWLPSNATTDSSSPISIPLSSVTHIFSPKKSIKSMFHSPRIRFQVSVHSRSVLVTLVIRGKGDIDGFLTKFWDCWRGRAWEIGNDSGGGSSSGSVPASGSVSGGGLYSSDGSVRLVGVSGILRKEQEMWESTDKSLQEAFHDLNALMRKAKEMVILAEKMRQKLLSGSSSQSNSGNDEEMGSKEEMQDWLLSVGIVSPVTKESAGAMYHQQLSRQLADFVRIPLEKAGGMINLIDIYCLFNRARGTELISPEDLLQACSLWEKFDVPVMLRKFDSGVKVIQNKSHSDEEDELEAHFAVAFVTFLVACPVFARIKNLVSKPEALRSGITASDAAMTLGIAPAMAKEHLLTAESKGLLCRDISPDGFRFFINLFPEINSDDIHMVKDHGIYSLWIKTVSAQKSETSTQHDNPSNANQTLIGQDLRWHCDVMIAR
ncbi:LOW QUALITY PROTEIN: vacuolar protein sorting-associated protein 36-like [Populus alba x Populus x berolinensis]|uniref:Vacuolar protein-sorting-associated protein 36 n=1 Tax=Populus alba x Populus x berolinensis TaxID=444605 RepID=A0AAD6MG81_9ROSI|nr:LOW QUALITY PROTEIN: vacuolar protein sorting-associated protein 36-like [Populus alba x Populus x berolinensis]